MYQEKRFFFVELYRVTRREGCTMRHNGWMLTMALLGAFLLTGCRATKEAGLEVSVSTETIMADAVRETLPAAGEALPTAEEILPAAEETLPVAEETSPAAEETSPAAEETLPEIETGRFIQPGIKSPMLEPTTQAIGEDPELIEPTTVASGESPSYLPLE